MVPPKMLSTSACADSWTAPLPVPPFWSIVIAFGAALTSIAVPPLPVILPPLTMAPANDATAPLTRMPTRPDTVPALLMPPVKVGPAILMAVAVEVIWLVPSMAMPRVVARMVPLSTIAPVIVLPAIVMPVGAVMVPALAMLPENAVTPETLMPIAVAVMTPAAALVMPPE